MSALQFAVRSPAYRRSQQEPPLAPNPGAVGRARARLEREGVKQSLQAHEFGEDLVAPGSTPWGWWALAGAWVVIWPSIVALRVAGSLTWLPWWMAGLLPLLHLLVLAGPVAWTEHALRGRGIRRRFGMIRSAADLIALEPDEFEVWSGMLLTLMGYRVLDTPQSGDHGVDLKISGNGIALGLVQCKRYRSTVSEATVRDLYGAMAHAGAGHGYVITTGGFSRPARDWAQGKPIELWDGPTLLELARKYR